ncbi:lipopolysaccharide biosynthesis protein [Clostridium perfringens]|uniref:lipopolysaccharide biosynthesis protein n=1 Tax=Clostridium perfringens TaxID=1502 RepID=UPI001094A07D|nr:oligosaccharide flippase family protein [Clostridium perfringens]TGY46116.1 polysaccharide biosynthesis protein [Clostridium perfringens]
MKIQRTKNAGRNIIFGIIQKLFQIGMPFIIRTVMIYQMGIEYAGLNNLFVSILQVLNLAELGIGAAMTCSMYEPIANDDEKKICALINLYRKSFQWIGVVILILGCVLLPFLPKLISGSIPTDLNLYILYLMYLGNTVLSYWLFAYKNSLLFAHQRTDVNSKVILFTNIIQYILQFYVLIKLKNYYLYLASSIFSQILTNIITARIVDRMYPKYKAIGNIDKDTLLEIKKKIQGLITNKIGGTILQSVDSIVISAFLGLSILAVYQNYYFIVSAVISIVYIFYQSCLAGIGNSLVVETKKKNFDDFKTMTFIVMWISTFCSSCFLCLFQPFMKIWMGDEYLLPYPVIICFVIYFYIFEIDQLVGTYKDAAGIWYVDRYRPIITALINLCLNLIMVQFASLYGVLLSTIISLVFVGIPWMTSNLFKYVFIDESYKKYLLSLIRYALISTFIITIPWLICNRIQDSGFITLILKLIICIILPNIIYIVIYGKNVEFKRSLQILKKILKKN